MPPAQGRPDRPPLGFADRRSSSRPPGDYGEAELPTVPPASSSVRVWSRGTHRPVVKIDPDAGLARTLSQLMLVPLLLLGAGVVLTIVNGAYAGENGQVLMIGPVRLAWVAATAVLTGLGVATYRLWARMA